MDDRELLKCLQEDASRGIELAINQYGKSVKTICQSILSGYSAQDIEETISDTFVGLWKSKDKIILQDGEGLREYLYGIARKTALNKRRVLSRKQPTEDLDEIAEILTIKAKTVENKLTRGRNRLKKQLIQSGIEVS